MPTFLYKAKKQNAETVFGQVTAETRDEAVEKINRLGLVAITIEDASQSCRKKGILRSGRVASRDVFLFSRQIVSLLKAGVSILRALELIAAQMRPTYFRQVVQNIRSGVQGGKSLSDAIAEYPQIFSALYVSMVKVGEESGRLTESIADVAEYQRRQQELLSRVRAALAYPILMAVFGIVTVFFSLTYVMPQITGLFVDLKQALPWQTILVMRVSNFLIDGWMVILLAILFLWGALLQWRKTHAGQIVLSDLILRTPFLGGFWLKLELMRFCRTTELLLNSGVSVVRALQLSLAVVRNLRIRGQIRKCRDELLAGRSFGDSLKDARDIPPMVGYLIAVGEESGSLGSTLRDIADTFERETQEAIKVMTTLLEPLMIILVGGIIGFIVIAMLLPIFQMDIFAR